MANDPRKKSPNWKSPAGGGGGKAPPPNRKRDWQGPAPKSPKPAGPRSKRGLMFGTLVFGGALLAGVVAWLLLINPYKSPRLVPVGPGGVDSTALPLNPYGAKVVRDLM